MRALYSEDVFAAMRFVGELELEDQIELVAMAKEGLTQKERGAKFIFRVIGKAGGKKAEEAFYEMISGPLEMPVNELRKMDPIKLFNVIKGLSEVIDVETYKDFFRSVVGTLT